LDARREEPAGFLAQLDRMNFDIRGYLSTLPGEIE